MKKTTKALKINLKFFNDGATENTLQEGQQEEKNTSNEGQQETITISKVELDKLLARTRKATESQMLGELEISDKTEIPKLKTAWKNSLTEDEKIKGELETLRTTKADYETKFNDLNVTLEAIETLTGKSRKDTETIVKMAKGLASDEVPISEAIKTVIEMTAGASKTPKAEGFDINQPEQKPKGKEQEYQEKYKNAKTVQEKVIIKQEAFKNGVIL